MEKSKKLQEMEKVRNKYSQKQIDMFYHYAKDNYTNNIVVKFWAWCTIISAFIGVFLGIVVTHYADSILYGVVAFIATILILLFVLRNLAIWEPIAQIIGFIISVLGGAIGAFIICWLIQALTAQNVNVPMNGFYIICAILTIFKIRKNYWISKAYVYFVKTERASFSNLEKWQRSDII